MQRSSDNILASTGMPSAAAGVLVLLNSILSRAPLQLLTLLYLDAQLPLTSLLLPVPLMLLVDSVAPDVAVVPAVADISAVAGVPAVAGVHAVADVPVVAGVPAAATVLAVL
jgi:hypothetical protein